MEVAKENHEEFEFEVLNTHSSNSYVFFFIIETNVTVEFLP